MSPLARDAEIRKFTELSRTAYNVVRLARKGFHEMDSEGRDDSPELQELERLLRPWREEEAESSSH